MVFSIATMKKGGFSPLRMVLAGAAVSAFLYAIADGIGIYFKISKRYIYVDCWGVNRNKLESVEYYYSSYNALEF